MAEPIKVLDHGLIRLVESMGNDLSIVPHSVAAFKEHILGA
jgi:hypothetical protein